MLVDPGMRAGVMALLSLALSTSFAVAQGNGRDQHDEDDDRCHEGDARDRNHDHGNGHQHERHERYADHDRDIRGWYRAHYDHLPPGLGKRDHLPPGLERQLIVNRTLPPGLRKKMQPCPRELEVMLPPPPNYAQVVIGGNLVLYNRASFQIADVFHFEIH